MRGGKVAKNKRPVSGGGSGTTTNYGAFVQDGVYITFIADLPQKITGVVQSPLFLKGRSCAYLSGKWQLV